MPNEYHRHLASPRYRRHHDAKFAFGLKRGVQRGFIADMPIIHTRLKPLPYFHSEPRPVRGSFLPRFEIVRQASLEEVWRGNSMAVNRWAWRFGVVSAPGYIQFQDPRLFQ